MRTTLNKRSEKLISKLKSLSFACALSVALASPAAIVAQQVCKVRELSHRFYDDNDSWTDIRAVSSSDSLLVVLTGSYPAVHVFSLSGSSAQRSWGRKGQGPGELEGPMGIAEIGRTIYVLDVTLRRLAIFEPSGSLVHSIGFEDAGMSTHYPLRFAGSDRGAIILDITVPMGNERLVTAAHLDTTGKPVHQDTVLVYRRTRDRLRLTAPGTPSYSVFPPYSPSLQWTPVAEGVAFWQGPGLGLTVVGLNGDTVTSLSLPIDDRLEVTEEDREFWFQNAIPQEMFGQKGVFEPVREAARGIVDFPRFHPLVFELIGAPDHTIWIRRTPDGRNQTWDIVDTSGQLVGRTSLSPGQFLMAVMPEHIVVKAIGDLDTESVEIYRCASVGM